MNNPMRGKKHMSGEEFFSEDGMYYKNLADKYHIAKYIMVVLLAVFVLAACVLGHREMRIQNFRYLVKSISGASLSPDDRYSEILYSAGSGVKFALYKDDLAVVGDGHTMLYRPDGSLLFRDEIGAGSAMLLSGEKYMAFYTPGAKSLAVYNSFSRVQTLSFENPIGLAAMSENGVLAVCTKSSSVSVVSVYDASFRAIYTWESADRLIFDLALSDDGKTLAILSLSGAGGAYSTELVVKNIKTDKTLTEETFAGRKPAAVSFFADGRFFAASDGMLCFYHADGKKAGTAAIPAGSFQYAKSGTSLIMLTSPTEAVIYSSRSVQGAAFSLPAGARGVKMHGEWIGFLFDTAFSVYRTDGTLFGGSTTDAGVLDFFILNDGSALLCYPNEAHRMGSDGIQ